MLDESELTAWYGRLNLNDRARMLIKQIRSSEPARRVRGGRSNVSGLYPSRKMGVSIQFESHRVELAAIYEMEHDPLTLEFYDQPPPMMLDYNSANGRRMAVRHTPDFFVLRQDSAGWEEWKTEEDLHKLNEHNPNRYRQEAGSWHCPRLEDPTECLLITCNADQRSTATKSPLWHTATSAHHFLSWHWKNESGRLFSCLVECQHERLHLKRTRSTISHVRGFRCF